MLSLPILCWLRRYHLVLVVACGLVAIFLPESAFFWRTSLSSLEGHASAFQSRGAILAGILLGGALSASSFGLSVFLLGRLLGVSESGRAKPKQALESKRWVWLVPLAGKLLGICAVVWLLMGGIMGAKPDPMAFVLGLASFMGAAILALMHARLFAGSGLEPELENGLQGGLKGSGAD